MSTAVLITARLKSVRLPMKAIRPIQGRPMISHLIDRLRLATRPERIVLCTSTLGGDDPLVDIARAEEIDCFRGHAEDVLYRLAGAASHFEADTIVSCTADNPFVDPEYIDRLVDFHHANGHDYSMSEGLPFGTFAYAVSRQAMIRACEIKDETDTEVWGGYFRDTNRFKWGVLAVDDPSVRWPELRLTVDTPEDFELAVRIFDELYEPGRIFPLQAIVSLCRRRPDLVAINSHILQKPARPLKRKTIQGL
jgi:spore coat polysaccharide biosynthesis protein SpsF